MTPDQLSAIRARLTWLEENGAIDLPFTEARALLYEVERLTAERDAAFRRGAEAKSAAIEYAGRLP